ncbi:SocA family protein [Candidatus Bipolaricaulota bacterium]|nr:SocA family protein [Candidatus Bipolaricaulota bacterium]
MFTYLDERKATQIAAWLLERTNGKMKYLKLVKLLYITDREAIRRWGQPLTGDSYYSLPHGPVVSRIQNLVTDDPMFSESTYWIDFISRVDYDVVLNAPPPYDHLSEAEIELLREIFDKFGTMSRWDLRDLTHEFPEWEDPAGSSIPITYVDILRAVGRENEAEEIAREIEADNFVADLLEC